LKNIRILENTYAKFQREIWKIDGDLMEHHLRSTERWNCSGTDEKAVFTEELYDPGIAK